MLKSKIGFKIVLVFFALAVILFFGEKFLLKEAKAGPTLNGRCTFSLYYRCNNGPHKNSHGGCPPGPCRTGSPWTKYKVYRIICGTCYFTRIDKVCMTGDKCISGEKGLRYGTCNCSYGRIYKMCCRGPTPVRCIRYYKQDGHYPPEGTCPSGTRIVRGTSCPRTCRDECSYIGQRQYTCRYNDRYRRVCENNDRDPCREWSAWRKYEECGNSSWTNDYRCSGSWRQRRYVSRGCSNNRCYSRSQWRNYQYCGSSSWTNNYRCSGNWRQRQYHYKGCSGRSCYNYYGWRNYQNCGSDYCKAWSSNYCKGDDVYHKRTCYRRGCSGSSCYNNPYLDERLVQKCEYGCLNGVCILAPLDNYPPYIESLILDGAPDYCNCPVGTGRIGFKWTYKDKDGDNQSHYWLQIATDSGFNNKAVDYTTGQIISSGSTGTSGVTVKLSPSPGKLEIGFNDTYYWRMKVKDKKGNWSSWENGSPATLDTPLNPYPQPTFTWELKDYEEGMPVVLFTNQTKSFAPPNSYSWTFQDGSPSTSNEENPTVIFTSTDPPEKEVTLSVVDSNGYFCPPSIQSVTVTEAGLPLPEWKEIPPF